MTDPNKPSSSSSGYKSKPPPPSWANTKNRRHTAAVAAPPKSTKPAPITASNRASRFIPHKPSPKPLYNKNKRPPPKVTSFKDDIDKNKRNSPPKAFKNIRQSGSYKPTPFILHTPSMDNNNDDDTISNKSASVSFVTSSIPPKTIKRASLQHTALSQMMSRSAHKTKQIKPRTSKSPPPPSTTSNNNNNNNNNTDNDDNKSSNISRWKHHPHARIFNTKDDQKDDQNDDNDKKPPPPPAPSKNPRIAIHENKDKEEEEDIARKYNKNITGFEEDTLSVIDKCNIEALLACMHEGSECLKNFHNALSTFARQQQTQCANFLKLFKKSKSRYAQMDTMPNFFYAISLVHGLLEETVKQSAEFAKFIQISCLPMIEELDNQCDTKYKEIYGSTKLSDKKLSDIKINAEKCRKLSKNAAEKVIIARQRNEVYKQNEKLKRQRDQTGDNKKGNILSNMSEMIKTSSHSTESTVNDAYNFAKEQEKKFKIAINDYNRERLEFIKKRNSGKHEIINMEHFRVDSMLSVFQKIVFQQRRQEKIENNKVYQLQNDIKTHIESMTAKAVISKFIHLNMETHGEWKIPLSQEATLDIEYRDMFHSVEDAMSITLEINPHVKIPLIVPLLCEKIRDLNGFHTEGIFRKSPNKTSMIRIKKRLQVKNFQLTEDNVHVYAALLKEWLRGLHDLIIPKRYYDYCVSMAKENKLNTSKFKVFFSQLPSVNRECLKYLINFLRDLLKPQYQQYTKMNLENIAIVFGPTLLMPPHELEPLIALQNAKSEKQFVISLIENS